MRVVPRTTSGRINFYNAHIPKWAIDPEAIGSTPEEIAQLQDKLDAAKDAFKQQKQAQNAARSATMRLKDALDALSDAGACTILRVRAKARADGQPVYSKAQITAPKKASPIGPPGKPSSFKWELGSLGELRITWKCKNPRGSQGTMYQVYRQLGQFGALGVGAGTAPFEYLGATGRKEFVDETLPAGTAFAMYKIRAVRSRTKGPNATFNVNFGVNEGDARLLRLSRQVRARAA